ncbi:uba/thif-type NAD/fad binding protein [Candidatus Magnetomorum sp. HK-1]|nr:uba/thif-type NAD/fad binding protein [Candidatus Magnetomorum sp. HK-1]
MIDIIKTFLESKGFIVEISNDRIITTHKIGNKDIKLAGELSNTSFPYSLPRIYLLDRNSYGSVAHVGWNDSNEGLICEGVSINRHIDYSNPEIVYLEALNNAVATLENVLKGNNKNKYEIISEFSAHWRFLVKDKTGFFDQNRKISADHLQSIAI